MASLKYVKVSTHEPVVDFITDAIQEHLAKSEKVLWLVTGGSTMPIMVAISRHLEGMELSNLTVTLSDERYGPVGHNDSNWEQLSELGFYLPGAQLHPVLWGKSLAQTTQEFNDFLKKAFTETTYSIGFMGIGPDSHIAGIKPGSPAITANEMAIGYKWDDYIRITMTFPAIKQLDCAVTYLAGERKKDAIEKLLTVQPVEQVPSQVLKNLKQVIIFNDTLSS